MKKNESWQYKGKVIAIVKKFQYVSNDFPASPFYEVFIDGEYACMEFTKAEAVNTAKARVRGGVK